jgi:4-amino-4-deoxy-L-arabinose transferase-like glycosyltransferase
MASSRVVHVWCRCCWPVLAGATAAVGLLDVSALIGLPAVALLVAGLGAFFALVLYGTASESGLRLGAAARIGLVAAVSILALLGLTELFPAGGWFIALFVGATSPALARHLRPHVRRGLDLIGRGESTGTAPDQARVDREFAAIVAQLEKYDA